MASFDHSPAAFPEGQNQKSPAIFSQPLLCATVWSELATNCSALQMGDFAPRMSQIRLLLVHTLRSDERVEVKIRPFAAWDLRPHKD